LSEFEQIQGVIPLNIKTYVLLCFSKLKNGWTCVM